MSPDYFNRVKKDQAEKLINRSKLQYFKLDLARPGTNSGLTGIVVEAPSASKIDMNQLFPGWRMMSCQKL